MRRSVPLKCAKQLSVLLREVIQNAPTSGISLSDVETEIKERMQITSIGTQVADLSRSLGEALREVNDTHYVCESTLYPCNWEKTMLDVAELLPREGVTEKEFVNYIVEQKMCFLPDSTSLGEPLCNWVQRHFQRIIHVARSAANGVPIYRAVEEPLSPEAECIFRALQMLGREKLPVFTDFKLIEPLLPPSINPGKGNWMRFVESEAVKRHFDIDVEAFVRIQPDHTPSTVFVDATSVEMANLDDILAKKGLSDSLCTVRVFRRPDAPVRSADDVVIENFLDPEHAMGAAIASMDLLGNNVNLCILCGDAVKERYIVALGDLLKHEKERIRICTPNSDPEPPIK